MIRTLLIVALVVLPACGCGSSPTLAPTLETSQATTPPPTEPERDAYEDALSAVRFMVPDLVEPNKIDTTRLPYAMLISVFGGRSIMANHDWLRDVALKYGHGAAVGVYAHELGHLPQVVERLGMDPETPELTSDAVAGCALAVLGHPIQGYLDLLFDIMGEAALARMHVSQTSHGRCDELLSGWGR